MLLLKWSTSEGNDLDSSILASSWVAARASISILERFLFIVSDSWEFDVVVELSRPVGTGISLLKLGVAVGVSVCSVGDCWCSAGGTESISILLLVELPGDDGGDVAIMSAFCFFLPLVEPLEVPCGTCFASVVPVVVFLKTISFLTFSFFLFFLEFGLV